MRYSTTESTNILAVFSTSDSVTIDIYDLANDSMIVNTELCTEIGSTGIFKYFFNHRVSSKSEYLWIMNNGTDYQRGKIVLGGFVDGIAQEETSQDIKTVTYNIEEDLMKPDFNELLRVIGLSKENCRIDSQYKRIMGRSYMISSLIRVYNTPEECEGNLTPIEEYQVSAEYDEHGSCTSYKLKKVI